MVFCFMYGRAGRQVGNSNFWSDLDVGGVAFAIGKEMSDLMGLII